MRKRLKHFRCGTCKRKLHRNPDWTEEDQIKEFNENFPGEDINDVVRVCDDCYERMNAIKPYKEWRREQ